MSSHDHEPEPAAQPQMAQARSTHNACARAIDWSANSQHYWGDVALPRLALAGGVPVGNTREGFLSESPTKILHCIPNSHYLSLSLSIKYLDVDERNSAQVALRGTTIVANNADVEAPHNVDALFDDELIAENEHATTAALDLTLIDKVQRTFAISFRNVAECVWR